MSLEARCSDCFRGERKKERRKKNKRRKRRERNPGLPAGVFKGRRKEAIFFLEKKERRREG
jgi:hypothetical protein